MILLLISLEQARATYQHLPRQGGATCPATGQFFHDQFCWLGLASDHGLECIACPDLSSSEFHASGLIRGGFPSTQGVRSLKRLGVGLIVDLRTVGEDPARHELKAAAQNGIAYFNLPMTTAHVADVATNRTEMERALGYFAYYRQGHPTGRVYFHCQRGEDRTGLVAAAERFLREQAPRSDVEKEMTTHYFNFHYLALLNVWKDLRVSDATKVIEPTAAEKVIIDRAP